MEYYFRLCMYILTTLPLTNDSLGYVAHMGGGVVVSEKRSYLRVKCKSLFLYKNDINFKRIASLRLYRAVQILYKQYF